MMCRTCENQRFRKKWKWLVVALFCLAMFQAVSGTANAEIYRVKASAASGGDGSSWTSAYDSLGETLKEAGTGDEIWVAAGTYMPEYDSSYNTPTTDLRTKTFALKTGVIIYGGFEGVETEISSKDRNPVNNVTILTGNIGNDALSADNSYHVIYCDEEDSNAVIDGFTITGGIANDYGGGMFIKNKARLTVANCTFNENYAGVCGGGIYSDECSLTVTDCTFIKNSSQNGGGMSCHGNSMNPKVINCTFSENTATQEGGGIACENLNITVTDCVFSKNSAQKGGAMDNNDANFDVINCTFSENTATKSGGGMRNISDSDGILTNCIFNKNNADENGGAIYNNTSKVGVRNCTFSENSSQNGGGMYNYKVYYEISCSPKSIMIDCTFSKNSATDDGGGMYNEEGTPQVTNCTFSENSAGYGGGMNNNNSKPTVTNCRFSKNKAQNPTATIQNYAGGGMRNENDSHTTVKNCTFSENSAAAFGGGMYSESSSPRVESCTFSANKAQKYYGGGIYNWNNTTSVNTSTVINCTFNRNEAGDQGGGIYNSNYSKLDVTNCTFSKNSAAKKGGGMFNRDSGPTVTNSIFWNNIGGEIFNENGSSPVVSYCVVSGDYAGGSNIISSDPCLDSLADNGCPVLCGAPNTQVTLQTCAILTGSSARTTGCCKGVTPHASKDQRGVERPLDSIDIGAYEVDITQQYTLKIMLKGDGSGTVTMDPTGSRYVYGTTVTLAATPSSGSVFAEWSGSLSGTDNGASVTMDSDKTVTATFKKTTSGPTPEPVPVVVPKISSVSAALEAVTNGTADLNLPDELSEASFEKVESSDVKSESLAPASVVSADVSDAVVSENWEDSFITGISFNIEANASSHSGSVGILPLDVALNIPKDKLSQARLDAIEENREGSGLKRAFLNEVRIFKVVGGRAYDLFAIALKAGEDPEDFFSVEENASSNSFQVSFGLLIVDAPAGSSAPVQPMAVSGDFRFLVLDGKTDAHFADPLVAVENSPGSNEASGGCSTGALLPGMALLLVPLMFLKTRR